MAVHVSAGALAMIFGFVALYSAKGAVVHRKTGRLFVYVILIMGVTGTALALIRDNAPPVNIPAAILTSYMALTALMTVRPSLAGSRKINIATMLVALTVGMASITFGLGAIAMVENGMVFRLSPFSCSELSEWLARSATFALSRSAPVRGARGLHAIEAHA